MSLHYDDPRASLQAFDSGAQTYLSSEWLHMMMERLARVEQTNQELRERLDMVSLARTLLSSFQLCQEFT